MTKSEQLEIAIGQLHASLARNYQLQSDTDKYYLALSLARVEYLIFFYLHQNVKNVELLYGDWIETLAKEYNQTAAAVNTDGMDWDKYYQQVENVKKTLESQYTHPVEILKERISQLITSPDSLIPFMFALKYMLVTTIRALPCQSLDDFERVHTQIVHNATMGGITIADISFISNVLEPGTIN